jgi:predicted enzyme related to lactoylglutathione lyase
MSTVPGLHAFCWLDLAATDATEARAFYAAAFGWDFVEQPANGGVFTRCRAGGRDVASLYALRRAERERGVPSHWTPYLCVADVDAAARRVADCGGRVLVRPFAVDGMARIALVADAVGALVGLWQGGAQSPSV